MMESRAVFTRFLASSNFLERIGSAIKDGYGVIINVDSNVLWGKTNVATLANHDVFIVGVSYEKNYYAY